MLFRSRLGPLPMALVSQGLEMMPLRRHLTAYEDELNDAFVSGELDDETYVDGLFDLYESPEWVDAIYRFHKGRQIRTRRMGIRVLCERAYASGIWDEDRIRLELMKAGYKVAYIDVIIDMIKTRAKHEAQLTVGQVLRAYQTGIKPRDWASKRLTQRGYEDEDREVLLALYAPKAKKAS